jgi:hypothetical protein
MGFRYIRPQQDVPGREHGVSLPFILTNSEYLVDSIMWDAAFEYIKDGCLQRGLLPEPNLQIYFRDLFFSRMYQKRRDFDLLWEGLEPITEIGYRPATLGRLDLPGRQLTFGPRQRLVLYEHYQETVLSTTLASPADFTTVLEGNFPHQPIFWQLKLTEFLTFLRVISQLLKGEGQTLQARLNIDVLGSCFLLRARRVYAPRFKSSFRQLLSDLGSEGEQMLNADRKRPAAYQKLWYGEVNSLKQMMVWQQLRVRGI